MKYLRYIFLILIIALIAYSIIRKSELEQNKLYAIGELIDYTAVSDGESLAEYRFYFNGKEYLGSNSLSFGDKKELGLEVGDHCVVKFSSKEPEISEMLFEMKVSKSIVSPKMGWKKITNIR